MTIRIAQGQLIGGLPAKEVRDLLRKCDGGFRLDWLQDIGLTQRESDRLIDGLVKDGFIKPSTTRISPAEPPWYELTDEGESLRRALAAKPISRKSAEIALKGFMERAHIVDDDARFLYRITAVVVYGSYIRGAERPADVDIAIDLERKIHDHKEFHAVCWQHFYNSGRGYRRIGYEFDLPREEIYVFLRQRKRTLSLHPMYDFVSMKKSSNFSYEVVLGNKEKIARDLAAAQIDELRSS
jgi:predicted nucleotidyltransferase